MNCLPDFLIIGACRSGTSSLHGYLSMHKDLNGPKYTSSLRSKELHFFDHCYSAGIQWYSQQFTDPHEDGKLYFESTPSYINEPQVPERVKYWMPDAKFIILLRDPVARAWSHYYFYWMHLYGTKLDSIYKALKKIKYRTKEYPLVPFVSKSYYYSIQCGMYVKQLKRWFSYFKPEQFMIIQSEDFFANPQATIAGVAKFLGVCDMAFSEYPIFDPLKNIAGAPYPNIPQDLEQKLIDFYRPYNEMLYEFLGYPMRGWRK